MSRIFDIFFIGDFEPNFDFFFKIFRDFKKNKIDFKELLEKAAKVSGIFVPSLNNKVERSILKDLNKSAIPIFQFNSNLGDSQSLIYVIVIILKGD